MALLTIENAGKIYNGEIIYENINFSVDEKDKIAIIGKNGIGKTTILKQVMEIEDLDLGDITKHHNYRVGYLSQAVIESLNNTIYEEMLIPFQNVKNYELKLAEILKKLNEDNQNEEVIKEYGRMEIYFDSIGGYEYELKIKMILNNLGFPESEWSRKISTFSGGERTKIAFARLLVDSYDLLILDEPTNHLDLTTISWLEGYLRKYDGAIILVSHDRYFIDKVCNKIIEVDVDGCEEYHGTYAKYITEKEHRFLERKKIWKLEEEEIQKKTDWIKRNKAKASKASQAKDMQRKLDKLIESHIPKPKNASRKMKLKFTDFTIKSDKILHFNHVDIGFEDKTLLKDVNFDIFGRDRVAILGDNGTGKSTLLKTINSEIKPLDGKINWFKSLNIGYFNQNHFEIENVTVYDYIKNNHPQMTNTDVRNHLAKFLFTAHAVDKKIENLSGGERVRLVLALMVLEKYDILLMDEPTNHLDIATKEVLEEGLQNYPGTLIFVSHDRYFINRLASKIIYAENQATTFFDGTYDNFMGTEPAYVPSNTKEKTKKKNNRKEQKSKNLNIKQLEKKIMELENEFKQQESFTYIKEVYEDPIHLREIELHLNEIKEKIEFLYKQYEEALIDLEEN